MSKGTMPMPQPQAQEALGKERISKLILRFSVPAIVSMVVNALYNIVDQYFIGNGIGELGMAATNIAFPLTTLGTALALLLGIGGASNFNLHQGRGNPEQAGFIAGNCLSLVTLLGVGLGILCGIFLQPMLVAFGATEAILPYARPYTAIIVLGLPFMIFTTAACHMIRADGSPRYAMIVMVSGAVFNVIFDPIFLFVFDMGIEGIAWATTLGQILTAILAAVYLARGLRSVSLTPKEFRPRLSYAKAIAALGSASCFNQLAMTVVQIALNNSLRHYGGLSVYGSEIPLACVGALSKLNVLFMAFVIGVAQGNQPIISYNYGAKNYARVREALRIALIAATALSFLAFALFQGMPRQALGLFGKQNSALYFEFGTRYLRIYMLLTFLNGIQPVASNFFTSIGKAKVGLFLSMTRQILFLLPLILIIPLLFGIDGLLFAGPLADLVSFVAAILLIRRELSTIRRLEAAA